MISGYRGLQGQNWIPIRELIDIKNPESLKLSGFLSAKSILFQSVIIVIRIKLRSRCTTCR